LPDKEDEAEEKSSGKQNLIIRRYWQILNLYPRISDPKLAERIENFTINATPEQLFRVQKMVFEKGTSYMVTEPRFREILERMDGEKVGLAIGDEYRTTISLEDLQFKLEMGIDDESIPVLSVASRRDYVDALLRRKDIIRMLVTRKLRATRKRTLVRWGLSFFDLLKDDSLFEDLASHQSVAEKAIAESMGEMDF
jgi:hypothetical protein